MPNNAKEFVQFQNRRKIINLCKNFLFLIEDLKEERSVLDEEAYQRIRKRVLDHGNDTVREMDENFKNLKIEF
jgi:hypothetical protein